MLHHISVTNEQLWPTKDRGPHRCPAHQLPLSAYKNREKQILAVLIVGLAGFEPTTP